MRLWRASLVLLALILPLPAQVTWTQLQPSMSPPPSPRAYMTFDEARECAVVVTGGAPGGDFETWEWNGTDWTRRFPLVSPPFRESALIAYDGARQRTVFAGGILPPAGFRDTWEWDGANWTLQSTQGPFPLSSSEGKALAYDDALQRILLVGYGTTWEWDGAQWLLIASSAIPPHPPSSFDAVMTYDRGRKRMVLFDASAAIWEWDGGTWGLVSTQVPSYVGPGAAWDAFRRRTVFFGRPPIGQPAEAQTWEWDGFVFAQRQPQVQPASRLLPAMTYDSVRNVVLLFSGALTNDDTTWQYTTTQPAHLESFGTGCPGVAGTPQLALAPFHLPWIGDTVDIDVQPIPVGAAAFLLLGLSNTMAGLLPLPFELSAIRMPGCSLYTSMESVLPMLNGPESATGVATRQLVMPSAAALAGTPFYIQAAVVDPAANPLGLIASDAQAGVLGLR